jgi:DNA-binding MarR family transcriptional regulator
MPVDKLSSEQVASALNSGAIHLLRSLTAIDKQAGLTPARLSALSVLVFAGPQSLGALAAAERVAGPTMTRIVDGLARSGLAERLPDPADGRAVLIAATAAGDSLMRAAAARRISAISAAIERLPAADQRRIAAAAGLLDKVAATVKAEAADAR